MEKEKRQEMVLAVLYFFLLDKHEASRADLVNCIKELQKKIPLGYVFGEGAVSYYSFELEKDTNDLIFLKGLVYHYVHDYKESMPKTFFSLKELGKGYAKRLIETLPPETVEVIKQAIEIAVKQVI